ncbi:Crp/Fnr family transcriptional regulator [Altererythrobacter sp. Z27]|uniref:Crp/Fnr family transcriptional regulator n=1 Tax=Altererythrobacter sp. Z27 TaxID=3461147 RepID=UPI004044C7A4
MSNILHFAERSLATPLLFSTLGAQVQDELRRSASRHRFAEGGIIQQRGDEARGFWLIERGSVAVGQFLPDGEFRATAVLGVGDSWGEIAMFAHRPRVVDAVARTPSELAFIRADHFERLLARDPAEMRSLLGALSAHLQDMVDLVTGIRQGSAQRRIAGLLANFARTTPAPVAVAITQQELGELLGLSRATVNSALRELEAAGCVSRSYGRIVIDQPDRLTMLSLAD